VGARGKLLFAREFNAVRGLLPAGAVGASGAVGGGSSSKGSVSGVTGAGSGAGAGVAGVGVAGSTGSAAGVDFLHGSGASVGLGTSASAPYGHGPRTFSGLAAVASAGRHDGPGPVHVSGMSLSAGQSALHGLLLASRASTLPTSAAPGHGLSDSNHTVLGYGTVSAGVGQSDGTPATSALVGSAAALGGTVAPAPAVSTITVPLASPSLALSAGTAVSSLPSSASSTTTAVAGTTVVTPSAVNGEADAHAPLSPVKKKISFQDYLQRKQAEAAAAAAGAGATTGGSVPGST
jgi:hypothetical protein